MKQIALILSVFAVSTLSVFSDDEGKTVDRGAKPVRGGEAGEGRRDADRKNSESRREKVQKDERPVIERDRPEEEERMGKVRHIREAAENLDIAGMSREAADLRRHAENLERAWHESQSRHDEGGDRVTRLEHQVRELHEVVEKLHRELEAIRRELNAGKKE